MDNYYVVLRIDDPGNESCEGIKGVLFPAEILVPVVGPANAGEHMPEADFSNVGGDSCSAQQGAGGAAQVVWRRDSLAL